mgnify:CR=1 FL=1
MLEQLLNRIVQQSNLECPICLMSIDSDVASQSCPNCTQYYHKQCLVDCYSNDCQTCEQRGLTIIDKPILLLRNLAKPDMIADVIGEFLATDIDLAEDTNNNLKTMLNLVEYVRLVRGTYKIPSQCPFVYQSHLNSPSVHNPNTIHNLDQFTANWQQYSYGLFEGFTWPKNLIVTGRTIPVLLLNSESQCTPSYPKRSTNHIDLVIYGEPETIKEAANHLAAHLAVILPQDPAQCMATQNGLKWSFKYLPVVIGLTCTLAQNPYSIMMGYSIPACQSYYDGQFLYATISAINSYRYQATYLLPRAPRSWIDYLQKSGLVINVMTAYPELNQKEYPFNDSTLDRVLIQITPKLIIETAHENRLVHYNLILSKVRQGIPNLKTQVVVCNGGGTDISLRVGEHTFHYKRLGVDSKGLIKFVSGILAKGDRASP